MKTLQTPVRFSFLAIGLLTGLLFGGCSHDHDDHAGHRDDDGEDSEQAEGRVALTEAQFRSAGIEVTSVVAGEISEVLTLPGTVAPNADAVLHVTPRVSGQVRGVFKQLGEGVVEGELLCVIDSIELGAAVAEFRREAARGSAAEETLERVRELYSRRLDALAKVMDGAVELQQRIYEREVELQEKAVSTLRPLLEADKARQMASFEKEKQLTELQAARDERLLELEVALRARRIDLTAARNRLLTLGLNTEEIDVTDDSPLLRGEYRVHAPGGGVVVNRHASTGEFVEAGSKLYIIENLSSVWFVASAFEEHLRSVRSEQPAYVSLDAFPGTILHGTVSFVDYHVDPTSRSVGVRISLDNAQLESWPEGFPLRPGMFGRVKLETTTRHAECILPERGLVHGDSGDYVFVQTEPFTFERRDVVVKHGAAGMVEIISGLEVGENVATSGTFLLKSAERQSELGGGHSH